MPRGANQTSTQRRSQQEVEDENAELRRQLERLKASQKVNESLIFKPKGQAGRGNGFNLYDEMGLSSTETYNVIRNVVRTIGSAHLDLRLTWTRQDSKAKSNARAEIRKLIPIMKYYHQAWPIKAFLKQYLGSSAAKYRKDINKIRALDEVPCQKPATPKSAEDPEDIVSCLSDESGRDSHEGSDDESDMDNMRNTTLKEKAKSKGKTVKFREPTKIAEAKTLLPTGIGIDDNDADMEDDGDDEVVTKTKAAQKLPSLEQEKFNEQAVAKKKLKGKTKSKQTVKPVKTTGANKSLSMGVDKGGDKGVVTKTKVADKLPCLAKKRTTRSSQQKKNKPIANTDDAGQAASAKKRKPEIDLEPRPAKQMRKNIGSAAEPDWPLACPDESCEDSFPSLPSKRLAAAYKAYLLHQTPFNAFLVCIQIQKDEKLPDLRQLALKNKWPIDIDFGSVTNRIKMRRDEISGLLTNEIVISASAAWKTFIRTLAGQSIQLSKFVGLSDQQKFSAVGSVAHCGYYGPKGIEIISAMIYSTILGKDQMTIIENLQAALIDVIENHRDMTIALAAFWDSVHGHLISLTNFIEYVVTPHVANLLIQEDLQLTEDKANAHRLRSKDVGAAFQYSDGNDEQASQEDSVSPARAVLAESSNTTLPTVRIPPRPLRNTRSKAKKLVPKQLTMNDFPPPEVKIS